MSKEAMKLALEALNNSVDLVVEDAYNAEKLYGNYPTRQGKVGGLKVLAENHKQAIKALEEALAKQEQGEPVAHINQNGVIHEAGYPWGIHNTLEPLYRHPPQQRTWVGLTDEDWKELFLATNAHTLPKAIEAKLKEKNGA